MYIPNKEALDKLPDLEVEAKRLQALLVEAKTAKKELREINKQVRDILKGSVKKRGPRKPKAKPAEQSPGIGVVEKNPHYKATNKPATSTAPTAVEV